MSGGPPWLPEEDAILCTLWRAGRTIAEIAVALPGRSEIAIGMRRKKLRLPARRPFTYRHKWPQERAGLAVLALMGRARKRHGSNYG